MPSITPGSGSAERREARGWRERHGARAERRAWRLQDANAVRASIRTSGGVRSVAGTPANVGRPNDLLSPDEFVKRVGERGVRIANCSHLSDPGLPVRRWDGATACHKPGTCSGMGRDRGPRSKMVSRMSLMAWSSSSMAWQIWGTGCGTTRSAPPPRTRSAPPGTATVTASGHRPCMRWPIPG
jgi:hypothetical protein